MQSEGTKRLWLQVALTGVLVLIWATILLSDFRFDAGHHPPGYGDSIYALEFARTPADVAAVLGPEGGPGYGRKLAQLSKATRFDMAFAAAYALFLFLAFAALRKSGAARTVCLAGMVLSAIAGAADMTENAIMLGMFAKQTTLPGLEWLWLPVHVKFAALGATALLAGVLLRRVSTLAGRVAGAACGLGGAVGLVALLSPSTLGWTLGNAIGLAWVAITAFAGWRAWQGRKAGSTP